MAHYYVLPGPCPLCEHTGPHPVMPDSADRDAAYRRPVQCVNCGHEFVIDTPQ